jgi:hypothetical protein
MYSEEAEEGDGNSEDINDAATTSEANHEVCRFMCSADRLHRWEE